MHFVQSALTLLALSVAALGITITSPGSSNYWVQSQSNTISWTNSSGDPSTIGLTVTNTDQNILNGVFSIQQAVNITSGSFTVTNVTLLVASGYTVNAVNTLNSSQVFASSQPFEVKAPGTTPASVSAASASATATNSSAASGTNTRPGAGAASASPTKSSASYAFDSSSMMAILICTWMAVAGYILAV